MEICRNLDIEMAMFHCLKNIKQFMPAHSIFLHLTEIGLNSIRTIAWASETEYHKLDALIPMPKEAIDSLNGGALPDLRIVNKPEEDPVCKPAVDFFSHYPQFSEVQNSSLLVMFLVSKGQRLGAVSLRAEEKEEYTEEHLKLFSLLNEPFVISLSNTLRHRELLQLKELLADDNRYLHQEILSMTGSNIIGADFSLRSTMEMVRQVAPLNSPVLLLGETGVGKDVIANAIHYTSPRKEKAFIKVNCGAIPDNLIDSELFGHERGAFTGAVNQRRGRFERAHKGSIFLDEIAELPLHAQVRFLRTIQNGEIERVGGMETLSVDVRIIAATNKNLEELVAANLFRKDLWFRLNVFPIVIPPLRERIEDIPQLLHHFIQLKSREMGIHPPPTAGPGAIDRLMAYHWPGNVRELENVTERALILSNGGPLMFDHGFIPEIKDRGYPQSHPPVGATLGSIKLDRIVSNHIKLIIKQTHGRIHGPGGAADLLGVKPGTLRYKMDKLGIRYKKKDLPAGFLRKAEV